MQLAFLEFSAKDPAAWDRFFVDVLGMEAVGGGRYRMDERAWRFQVIPGERNDLSAIGWEVEDLDAVDGEEVDPSVRQCQRRKLLRDPAGIPVELVEGLASANTPFVSELVPGGFVADDLGLGHAVVTAPDPDASRAFYDALGFRYSDRIACEIHGFPVDLAFFHCNARHHSLAFGGPQRSRLHHFMVEAHDIDAVGAAFDRTLNAGLEIMQTLGRHPNDRMLSFYAKTPGGFQFEFGWGGRVIDGADWEPQTYDRISEWGHLPPRLVWGRK